MGQATITFRIDEDMKEELNGICEALGLTLSGALTIFAKKMISERGLPFDVKLSPNVETLMAIEEAKKIAKDPNIKSYKTAEEAFKDILGDDY